jgi:hypothetical protein
MLHVILSGHLESHSLHLTGEFKAGHRIKERRYRQPLVHNLYQHFNSAH